MKNSKNAPICSFRDFVVTLFEEDIALNRIEGIGEVYCLALFYFILCMYVCMYVCMYIYAIFIYLFFLYFFGLGGGGDCLKL